MFNFDLKKFLKKFKGIKEEDSNIITDLSRTYLNSTEREPSSQGWGWAASGADRNMRTVLKTIPKVDTQLKEEEEQQVPVETNRMDPNAQSNLPQYNACPAYLATSPDGGGICRLTGKVCLYDNTNYKTNCTIYNTATSSDPTLWEVPPGREQTMEYQRGMKF